MAQVKPFRFDSDGFPIEMDEALDDITFNSLTLTGGELAMGSSKITGLAPGTLGTDGVNKDQLDSVAAGFDPKESCRLKTVASLSTWTPAGSGVGATLTAPTDAAANNDFDGVTAALNDRVLVTFAGATEVADIQNGIYTVTALGNGAGTSTELTRALDFDADAEVTAGAFTFVTEGATAADTGWYVVTDDPIVVDTTAFLWSQFAGLGSFTGGDGINIASGVISVDLEANGAGEGGLAFDVGELRVDPGLGIELTAAGVAADLEAAAAGAGGLVFNGNEIRVNADTAAAIELTANGVAINIEATNPSLQFAANELGIKFDPAGALEKLAAGVHVRTDDTTIQINGSNQLEVIGGGTVDQYTLTAGTGGVTIGDPVYVSANDTGLPCDNANNNTRRYVGVATATVAAAASFAVQQEGVITPASIGGAPSAGDIVWLDSTSGVTVALPTGSGTHRMVIGKMKNATDIIIEPQYISKID